MKSSFSKILVGLALPLSLVTAVATKTENLATTPTKHFAPYIVEVVSPAGQTAQTWRGTSEATDPAIISKELGATVYPEDHFKAIPPIEMGIGSQITLLQAPVITVIDGKKTETFRSWQKTVGDFMTEAKIPVLGLDDRMNFSQDTTLSDKMEIKITRVAKTTVIESESIAYNITKKPNPNLEKNVNNILQTGINGKKNKYYSVTREDGVQVSKVLQKSEIASVATDEILEVGTKVVVYATGQATWYVKSSDMIAASNTIPRGTKVHIVNTSTGKSVDVTISGGGIDHSGNVVVDLSTAAFQALGVSLGAGVMSGVRVEKYYSSN